MPDTTDPTVLPEQEQPQTDAAADVTPSTTDTESTASQIPDASAEPQTDSAPSDQNSQSLDETNASATEAGTITDASPPADGTLPSGPATDADAQSSSPEAADTDPTPAQTDPAASAAPGETTGGDAAPAADDTSEQVDSGIIPVSYQYDTNTSIIPPAEDVPADPTVTPATETDTGATDPTVSTPSVSEPEDASASDSSTPDTGADDADGQKEDAPAGEAPAAKTPEHVAEFGGTEQTGNAGAPPASQGVPGEGLTGIGTDTPEVLTSRPADPHTGRPLDGSGQPPGIIVGGSGALNRAQDQSASFGVYNDQTMQDASENFAGEQEDENEDEDADEGEGLGGTLGDLDAAIDTLGSVDDADLSEHAQDNLGSLLNRLEGVIGRLRGILR